MSHLPPEEAAPGAAAAGLPRASSAAATLEDFILRIPRALPGDYCDALLAEYAGSDEWNVTRVAEGLVKRDVRNADVVGLSRGGVIEGNRRIRLRLDDALSRHTAAVIRQYAERFPHFRIARDMGFELLRYPEGGFYKQHTDSYHQVQRTLACSFLVNDGFEGGEFSFFDGTRKFALDKGDALLFPANFMYPHAVLPVTRGVRYSVVTWFI